MDLTQGLAIDRMYVTQTHLAKAVPSMIFVGTVDSEAMVRRWCRDKTWGEIRATAASISFDSYNILSSRTREPYGVCTVWSVPGLMNDRKEV